VGALLADNGKQLIILPRAALASILLLFFASGCLFALSRPAYQDMFLGIENSSLARLNSLSGTSQNIFGIQENPPPVKFFFARLLYPLPSVNGASSSSFPPSIAWLWGDSHEAFGIHSRPRAHPDCPEDSITYAQLAPPAYSFAFSFEALSYSPLAVQTSTLRKLEFSAPPSALLKVPFSHTELEGMRPGKNPAQRPILAVSVDSSATYSYKAIEQRHSYSCAYFPDGSKGCGCTKSTISSIISPSFSDKSNLSIPIESGPVLFSVLRPALLATDLENETLLILIFSNRNLSYIAGSFASPGFPQQGSRGGSDAQQAGQGDFGFLQPRQQAFEAPLANYSIFPYSSDASLSGLVVLSAAVQENYSQSSQGQIPLRLNKSVFSNSAGAFANDTSTFSYVYVLQADANGLSPNNLLSLSAYDLFGSSFNFSVPFAKITRHARSGENISTQSWPSPMQLLGKGGSQTFGNRDAAQSSILSVILLFALVGLALAFYQKKVLYKP